jgi:hypothetical protein
MKKGLFFITLLMISVSFSYGQFSFGVSPGIGLNSAYFGYKVDNKFVPYIGFQYLNAKFKYEESGQRYDWDLNQVMSYSETNEFSGSLYIPNIGLKYFVKQQNKLRAYVSLNISKPLLSGKLKYDGEEDEDFKEDIKNISMWGGEFGFGMEYFFDENFSLGGEFGFRYIHLKYEASHDREIYNPDIGDYQDVKIEDNFKFNTSPTFSKISLNFYF